MNLDAKVLEKMLTKQIQEHAGRIKIMYRENNNRVRKFGWFTFQVCIPAGSTFETEEGISYDYLNVCRNSI